LPADLDSPSPSNGERSGHTVVTGPSHAGANRGGVPDPAIPISGTTPMPIRELLAPPQISAEPAPVVTSKTIPAGSTATKGSHARKWAMVAMLLVLFSIGCVVVALWVKFLPVSFRSDQAMKPPNTPAPITEPSESGGDRRQSNELVSTIPHKARTERISGHSESENWKPTRPANFQPSLPLNQDAPSTPISENVTPPTATKSLDSGPPPASLPDNSVPAAPGPTIVAGRVLRPTDRFNPCHLMYRVEPTYPPEAQQQRIEGTVKIHVSIGTDGIVLSTKLLSGSSLLAPAAMDAAKYWRYIPALLNGQPVETEQDIQIDFQLPH